MTPAESGLPTWAAAARARNFSQLRRLHVGAKDLISRHSDIINGADRGLFYFGAMSGLSGEAGRLLTAGSPLLRVLPAHPAGMAWREIRLRPASWLCHDSPEFPVR